MPNPLTHFYFANKTIEEFPETKGILKKERCIFDYAAMGPDVLYGLKLVSDIWKGNWGEYMHSHFVKDVFIRAARTLKNTKHDRLWRETCAYALGLLTHYVLDSRMHGYVYEYEHNRLPDKVPSDFDENIHMLVETAFDYHVLVELEKRPNKERAYKLFHWNGKTSKAMREFFNYALGDLFPFRISNADRLLTTNICAFVSFLSHKSSHFKYRVTRLIERKTGFKHLLTAGYRTGLGDGAWDILNAGRKPFDLVAGGNSNPSTETFDEAYLRAAADARVYLAAFLQATEGDFTAFDSLDFSLDYNAEPVKDEGRV